MTSTFFGIWPLHSAIWIYEKVQL